MAHVQKIILEDLKVLHTSNKLISGKVLILNYQVYEVTRKLLSKILYQVAFPVSHNRRTTH